MHWTKGTHLGEQLLGPWAVTALGLGRALAGHVQQLAQRLDHLGLGANAQRPHHFQSIQSRPANDPQKMTLWTTRQKSP